MVGNNGRDVDALHSLSGRDVRKKQHSRKVASTFHSNNIVVYSFTIWSWLQDGTDVNQQPIQAEG